VSGELATDKPLEPEGSGKVVAGDDP